MSSHKTQNLITSLFYLFIFSLLFIINVIANAVKRSVAIQKWLMVNEPYG
jgi:hypothetical protein